MYGIKATTDLSFLKGKTLCQVCFGPYDLQLNFAEGTRISVESTVGYGAADGTYAKRVIGKGPGMSEVLEDTGFLLRLLMKEVADVHWTAEGTMTLTFTGGSRLQLYDDSQQFESYNVGNAGQLIVV
jgi:hypothetical protein